MKCPKCGYLGFERVERCRNCGYDFSLTTPATIPDLNLRSADQELAPLDDLSLIDAATAAPPAIAMADANPDLDRVLGDSKVAASYSGREARAEPTLLEAPDDEPLIKRASAPRPPLAVRRATPEVPRLRNEQPRAQTLELALDGDSSDVTRSALLPGQRAGIVSWPPSHPDLAEHREENATVTARILAVAIDLLLLSAIDAIVIYFTMQICGLTLEDLGVLPKGPLLAFLLVQNGGYLVAFTAGGQTLGKMAAGIRVVPTESASLDLGHAFLREFMWVLLAVPVGLGFVTALFSRDHRGLHDRFAGTRVVRATA
jgi:uncharacterized RDD family membrane protein YckC